MSDINGIFQQAYDATNNQLTTVIVASHVGAKTTTTYEDVNEILQKVLDSSNRIRIVTI